MASSRDPADEDVSNVDNLLSLGPIQPTNIDYPKTSFSGKDYRFQERWYHQYDWIEYSISKDAAFCFPCRIFGRMVSCSEPVFTEEGFRNWKKATGTTGKLEKHAISRAHKLSKERMISKKTITPVNVQLSKMEAERMSKKQTEKAENRHIVEVLFDVVRHLCLQSTAFRGNDESESSNNQGKFLEEVKFVAKYHKPLKDWLDTHPGNVTWLGHDVQDEMIEIIAQAVIEIIREYIVDSKYYSVMCDEVTSHKHSYMSIVIRYVHKYSIHERVVSLSHVISMTGKSLGDIIIEKLNSLNIPLINMVGKGFDGASNMSGKEKGVQKILTDAGASNSVFFHCFGHCLNLVLGKCAETISDVKDVFEIIGAIYSVMEGSPKRINVYESKLKAAGVVKGRTALLSFSDTRWTARVDNLSALLNSLPAILATLEELASEESTCRGLLTQIGSFAFLVKCIVLKSAFERSRYASDYLQREDMDMTTAVDSIITLKHNLKAMRTESAFNAFISDAKETATTCGTATDFTESRKRKLPKKLSDGQTVLEATFSYAHSNNPLPSEDPKTTMRRIFYYPFIDLILAELDARFSVDSCTIMKNMSAFSPKRWGQECEVCIRELAAKYQLDEDSTYLEYTLFRDSPQFNQLLETTGSGSRTPVLPTCLELFQNSIVDHLYPNLFELVKKDMLCDSSDHCML